MKQQHRGLRIVRTVVTTMLMCWALTIITLSLLPATLAKNGEVDRDAYAAAWNDIEHAVETLNTSRSELGTNLQQFPPWQVVSDVKQQRRRELYDAAARDAERIAKRYRQLRDLDR